METRDPGVRSQLGILETLFPPETKTAPAGKASTLANPAPIGPWGNDPETEHIRVGVRVCLCAQLSFGLVLDKWEEFSEYSLMSMAGGKKALTPVSRYSLGIFSEPGIGNTAVHI